jgi:hypothetical protein
MLWYAGRDNWTAANRDAARAEGWNVFDCIGSVSGPFQICKYDEEDRFENDTNAWRFVWLRSVRGYPFTFERLPSFGATIRSNTSQIKKPHWIIARAPIFGAFTSDWRTSPCAPTSPDVSHARLPPRIFAPHHANLERTLGGSTGRGRAEYEERRTPVRVRMNDEIAGLTRGVVGFSPPRPHRPNDANRGTSPRRVPAWN